MLMVIRYAPLDIATYFVKDDLTDSQEKMVINYLWDSLKKWIEPCYLDSKDHFLKAIFNEVSLLSNWSEIQEINFFLQETGSDFMLGDDQYNGHTVAHYFKVIKLSLFFNFSEKDYRKIKMRNILRFFGYKRRTEALITLISRVLDSLHLQLFKRGKIPCNIAKVAIDDMVIIRIKS